MAKQVYYIPEGIPNIESIFPGVDFSTVTEWYLTVKAEDDTVLATTRNNKVGCCCDNKIRIHFINACGEIDSINFNRPEENHEAKSDTWEQSLRFPLDRTKGGTRRSNITSNEIIEAETKCYPEGDQYWIQELMDTPLAWMEQELPNGFQAPGPKEYIPIEIYDLKFPLRKNEKRYEYLVKIKFAMANANLNLR
jgi:hypothetical protein